jgi:hypothetical protein
LSSTFQWTSAINAKRTACILLKSCPKLSGRGYIWSKTIGLISLRWGSLMFIQNYIKTVILAPKQALKILE